MTYSNIRKKIPLTIIREGLTKALVPDLEYFKRPNGLYEPSWAPVFYNPRMEFNRDIAVLFINTVDYPHKMVVTDPLAGTGIRGIRYAIECSNVEKVYINDINPIAYELMLENVKLNNVEDRVVVDCLEANLMLRYYTSLGIRFDLIDIDPFGSPIPFIDSALNALRNGGFIAVTATDTAPLTGTHADACLRRYHVRVSKTDFEKEIAVRALLASLALRGAVYDLYMEVCLSYYADHYVRAYVRYYRGARKATSIIRNEIGYILYCYNCLFRNISRESFIPSYTCPICSSKLIAIGPLWIGKLGKIELVDRALIVIGELQLNTKDRIITLLTTLREEYKIDSPYYYRLDKLCSKLHTSMPPMHKLIEEIERQGYRVVRSHFDSRGLRTDIPYSLLKELILNIKSRS